MLPAQLLSAPRKQNKNNRRHASTTRGSQYTAGLGVAPNPKKTPCDFECTGDKSCCRVCDTVAAGNRCIHVADHKQACTLTHDSYIAFAARLAHTKRVHQSVCVCNMCELQCDMSFNFPKAHNNCMIALSVARKSHDCHTRYYFPCILLLRERGRPPFTIAR